jgi:hypothetical protein
VRQQDDVGFPGTHAPCGVLRTGRARDGVAGRLEHLVQREKARIVAAGEEHARSRKHGDSDGLGRYQYRRLT